MHVSSHSPDSRLGMRSVEGTAGPRLAISPALAEPERTASSWLSCPRDAEGRVISAPIAPHKHKHRHYMHQMVLPSAWPPRAKACPQHLPSAALSPQEGRSAVCVGGERTDHAPAQPALPQPSCPGSFSPQHCLPGWHQVAMQPPLLGAKGPQLAWSVPFSALTGPRGLICRGRQCSGGNDGRFRHFLTLPEFQHNDVRITRLFKSQRLGCFL